VSLVERYGRWAVIAGASVGLGRAISEAAAGHGFDLVMLARRGEILTQAAREITDRHGVEVRTVAADLTSPDITGLVGSAIAGLDVGVFVYNAAAEPVGSFLRTPVRKQIAAITVNCVTPTLLVHQIGAQMAERGRGSIALVTTIGAFFGSKLVGSYAATKAYELNLAEGLWDEWSELGLDVLAYVVGSTATPNYFSVPEEVSPVGVGAVEVDDPLETLLNRGRNPMLPADVASRLFELLDRGPTQFASPIDERLVQRFGRLERADAIRMQGQLISDMLALQGPRH